MLEDLAAIGNALKLMIRDLGARPPRPPLAIRTPPPPSQRRQHRQPTLRPISIIPSPAYGSVRTRTQVAIVVCQAIKASGLRPYMCASCDELHLIETGRRIDLDELTPSVSRAIRLIPSDVLAAWEAMV